MLPYMTRSESRLISSLRGISETQEPNTQVSIDFINWNNPKTHVGHLFIGMLSPKEIVVVYCIEDVDDYKQMRKDELEKRWEKRWGKVEKELKAKQNKGGIT